MARGARFDVPDTIIIIIIIRQIYIAKEVQSVSS